MGIDYFSLRIRLVELNLSFTVGPVFLELAVFRVCFLCVAVVGAGLQRTSLTVPDLSSWEMVTGWT